MTACERMDKALALFAGGDLDATAQGEVAAHLRICERCRRLRAEVEQSLAWLQAADGAPLDAADLVAVRRGVWREIEALGPRTPSGGGIGRLLAGTAGLLAAAVLAMIVFLPKSRVRVTPVDRKAGESQSPVLENRVASSAPSAPTEASAPPASALAAARRPSRGRGGSRARDRGGEVVQIEFQTANPSVRIIWLAKRGAAVPAAPAGRNQEAS